MGSDDDDEAVSVSPFEAIRHTDDDEEETGGGGEYWSARELARVLGYTRWEQFPGVVAKAKLACEHSDQDVADHFRDAPKMIQTGKGARRSVLDWALSRYACYLIVQNADPDKPIVALGQTYFAVQTRRQELADADAEADELAGLSETQRRLYIRAQVTEHNRQLADAAYGAGVITTHDFAVFQDHGYAGLYNGERSRDIAARKGLTGKQKILDYMGSTELAANLFRATQTDEKLRRDAANGITGKGHANATHHAVGREVRGTIQRLGGTMPEDLPTPAQSIQQLQRAEQQRQLEERQPRLFPAEDEDAGE
jgi:DNA-damage-inducible protein D